MRRFLILLATLSIVCAPSAAQAWFKFRNKTSATVWVSFLWYSPGCSDGGDWTKKGWWKLEPGQIKTVFGSDLQSVNTYYYYYAESSDGTKWSGPFNTCVPQSAYAVVHQHLLLADMPDGRLPREIYRQLQQLHS